tara:strand:+ start:825 stop:1025 length:201 start_codon:yes stop_codon:yes gene_type:complete
MVSSKVLANRLLQILTVFLFGKITEKLRSSGGNKYQLKIFFVLLLCFPVDIVGNRFDKIFQLGGLD